MKPLRHLFICICICISSPAKAAPPGAEPALAFTPQEEAYMQELVGRARRGITNAAIKLADQYADKHRYEDAIRWYRHAFIRDSGRGGIALYHLYKQGHLSLKNPEAIRRLSLNMLEQAALEGDASSSMQLGLNYLKGEYVETDYDKSLQFLLLASEQGKPMAFYHLGNIFSNGLFAAIQPRRALAYYQKASDSGVADATRQIGLAYLTGLYYTRDVNKAEEYLIKSSEQGSLEAMRDLANYYRFERQNMDKYRHWIQKAADRGNEDAQYYLGLYYEGKDPQKAREYFTLAAQNHHFMARQKLPQDPRKAKD